MDETGHNKILRFASNSARRGAPRVCI
jgi:hypothetical protein